MKITCKYIWIVSVLSCLLLCLIISKTLFPARVYHCRFNFIAIYNADKLLTIYQILSVLSYTGVSIIGSFLFKGLDLHYSTKDPLYIVMYLHVVIPHSVIYLMRSALIKHVH